MKKLNVGFITTVSGRWPRELPNERLKAYSAYLKETFPKDNILEFSEIIDSPEKIEEATLSLKSRGADIIIVLYGAFTGDDVTTYIAEELKVPMILWSPREPELNGGRLLSNGLVCLTMNSASVRRLGYTCYTIFGDKEEAYATDKVKEILTTYRTIKRLKGTVFGLFGYRPTAFYNSTFDEALIRKVFGVRMEETDLKVVFDRMETVDAKALEKDLAFINENFQMDELPEEYKENHSKLYLTLKELMAEQNYEVAAIKCWPEMGVLKTTPCAVLGRLADENKVVGCEGDVDVTLASIVQNYLTEAAVFVTDLININEAENYLTFWHCGNGAPSLHHDKAKAKMQDHPLAGQGTAFNTLLKTGEVTVARFCNIGGVYKLFLMTGEAIVAETITPGSTVHVKTKAPVRDVIEYIIEKEVPHHYSVVWSDVAKEMKNMCEVLNIEVLEI